jgi:hypothetical protein
MLHKVLEKIYRMTFQSLTTPTLNDESHDVYSVLSGLQPRFILIGSLNNGL